MNIEQKFQLIDQSKLTDSQKKILSDLKKGTKNFKTDDDAVLAKAEKNLDVIIDKLKEKNPEAIKSSPNATPKTSGSNRLFDVAKEIRKPNETWKDALSRAKEVQKKNNEAIQKTMNAEMAKLLDFVKNRKELDGISGTTIKKDAKLEARVRGKRVSKAGWKNQYGESKGGRVYYENRDNRSDRLAPSYPNKDYKLQAGGNLSTADLAGVPTAKTVGGEAGVLDGMSGTQYTDLVGETGALSAGELFAKGGVVDAVYVFIAKTKESRDAVYKKIKNFMPDHPVEKLGDLSVQVIARPHDKELMEQIASGSKVEVDSENYAKGGKTKDEPRPKWALLKDRRYYNHFEDHENRYSKGKPHRKGYGYAKGGALSSHGLEAGDTIVKTLSGGVQKIKTKDGKTMYVDLSNGYRDTTPPLPFEKGGKIKNKYEGVYYGDFWDKIWSNEQKNHFLSDHKEEIGLNEDLYNEVAKRATKPMRTSAGKNSGFQIIDSEKLVKTKASELPRYVKLSLEKHIREGQYANGGDVKKKVRWQEVESGDMAHVIGGKSGVVIKTYGRKFHIKFVDDTEKTYDASELEFFKDPEDNYAKGGVVVTKVSDIPNFKKNLDEGKITYRGLGMGKLSDDFYDLAGENGTRIKVEGKEYFITSSEFNKFSRDPQTGKMVIKFDAPFRKDYGGDMFAKGGRVLTPRERYVLEISGLTGVKVDAINKYIDENDLTNDEILNIVVGLGRKQIKNGDVSTAIIGTKNNSASKEIIEFAKGDRAMRLAKGGKLPNCKKTAKHRAEN